MTSEQGSPGGMVLASVLTCPRCGHAKREDMPVDACQFFYECESCKTLLRPKPGDCCVFCSFGSVKCPSMQARGSLAWRASKFADKREVATPCVSTTPTGPCDGVNVAAHGFGIEVVDATQAAGIEDPGAKREAAQ